MGGTIPSELGPLTSIINEENALQACLQVNLMGTFTQLKFTFIRYFSLSQIAIKKIKEPNQYK